MRGTLILLGMLAALAAVAGCATADNLFGKNACKVYGGTQLDATLVSEGLSHDSKIAKSEGMEHPVLVYEGLCGLADMPLSVVADTLTLPITVPIVISRQGTEAATESQGSKNEKAGSSAGSSAN